MKIIIFFLISLLTITTYCQTQELKDGKIFLPINRKYATVTMDGFNKIGYKIYNNPIPHNRKYETPLRVRVNGKFISYNNKPVLLYPKGQPFIEGNQIDVFRVSGITKRNVYLNYNLISYPSQNKLKGYWAFNGNNGPSLVVSMKKPRGIRLYIDKLEPQVDRFKNYEFIVIVDGVQIASKLTNYSSIDVYGKEVFILLSSWSPSTTGLYVLT